MSDHYVAVRPAAVNISYDESDKKWRATMNTDADQLGKAPADIIDPLLHKPADEIKNWPDIDLFPRF